MLEKLLQRLMSMKTGRQSPVSLLSDLSELIDHDVEKACYDHDELLNHLADLESENAELRRRLIAAGLDHHIVSGDMAA